MPVHERRRTHSPLTTNKRAAGVEDRGCDCVSARGGHAAEYVRAHIRARFLVAGFKRDQDRLRNAMWSAVIAVRRSARGSIS